jgi:carbonic anhydrase
MTIDKLSGEFRKIVEELIEGNKAFIEGKNTANLSQNKREELLKGQFPIATILTCSDSRVVPEYIFNQGLGRLFIVRSAGEVIDDINLASLEYGVEHLKTPILIVLGHTHCGAVNATISHGHLEGHLPLLVKKIEDKVEICKQFDCGSKEDFVNDVIKENALEIAESLPLISEIIDKAVNSNKTIIIFAIYYLETGKVEFLIDTKSHLSKLKLRKQECQGE